jgi:FkbM family methyltransferase
MSKKIFELIYRKFKHRKIWWKLHIWRDGWDNILKKTFQEAPTPYGFKLTARKNSANRAMLRGTFEPEEAKAMQRYLPQVEIFVDVGANIGFYGCLAMKSGKYSILIEPQPGNLKCLWANLLSNGWQDRAEVYPLGLGASPGIQMLYGASGPSASLIPKWAQYSDRFKRIISVTTLDIILGQRFINKRLLIKIDVEGYEYHVLKGSLKTMTLSPRPIWLIEICLSEYHPSGLNPNYKATFGLFWENGYEARTADSRNLLIRPDDVDKWWAKKQSESGTINYIFRANTLKD